MRSVIIVLVLNGAVLLMAQQHFTNEWAVEINHGDDAAQQVADEHNFEIVDKVFHNVYVFRHRRLAKRSLSQSVHHHHALRTHPKVNWAEQQKVKRRTKRDFQHYNSVDTDLLYQQQRHQQQQYVDSSGSSSRGGRYDQPHGGAHVAAVLNDPRWPEMWYLNRGFGLDMRVQEAWAIGVTGKGVVATILDDGLEKGHPDIIKNYDPDASYDVNNRDSDPVPRYDLVDTNRHGTRCAGEVAADANNTICAVGVAFEASIGGVRMLDGDVTDAVEARSLALNPQHIDIYSASWGPDDDGKTVDGPGELATRAFIEGIEHGRNGLGSIFIWASGNGGRAQDNCNCDGYTNAIWTLSISSATEMGNVPWYSEACSSTLATTYSSGSAGERKIITTDLHHECTASHTGTSASAPLAAGIVALALEVNKNITWRDMQHIVVRTARPENLETSDWQTNGVGRKVSHRFGYGLMDAYAMVLLAKEWITVAPQRVCEVQAPRDDKLIPQKSFVTLKLEVSACPGVNHLEHVQAMVSLSADRRGDLEVFLISPAGTKSTLLTKRPHDNSRAGFHSWPFMSVHMWGEQPLGVWTLEVHNNGHFYSNGKTIMRGFTLVLHGTEVEPGQPAPPATGAHSGPPSSSNIGITHSDLTHSSDLPSNTQRDNPSDNAHTGRAPNYPNHPNDKFGGYNDDGHPHDTSNSAAPKAPVPSLIFGALPGHNVVPSVKKAGVDDLEHHQSQVLTGPQASLPPGCITMDPGSAACIECETDLFLFRRGCVKSCPEGLYSVEVAHSHESPAPKTVLSYGKRSSKPSSKRAVPVGRSKECRDCHYSCRRCLGPAEQECTKCWQDGSLQELKDGAGHCFSTALLDALKIEVPGKYKPLAVLLIVVSVLALVLVGVVLLIRYRNSSSSSSGYHSNGMSLSDGVNGSAKRGWKINGLGVTKLTDGPSAAYRKLSDDTEQLVTSTVPFYDVSSSEDEIDIGRNQSPVML